jgi:hypothetical protein
MSRNRTNQEMGGIHKTPGPVTDIKAKRLEWLENVIGRHEAGLARKMLKVFGK